MHLLVRGLGFFTLEESREEKRHRDKHLHLHFFSTFVLFAIFLIFSPHFCFPLSLLRFPSLHTKAARLYFLVYSFVWTSSDVFPQWRIGAQIRSRAFYAPLQLGISSSTVEISKFTHTAKPRILGSHDQRLCGVFVVFRSTPGYLFSAYVSTW